MNDETAEDTVEVVEDPQDVGSDNLEDKVNNEKDEGDDSFTSSVGTKVSEIAEDERQYLWCFSMLLLR